MFLEQSCSGSKPWLNLETSKPESLADTGSEYRTTTFFRLKNGDVGVRCGCFYGTLQEFRDKVRATHKETKKAKEYLMLADLMELRFSKE